MVSRRMCILISLNFLKMFDLKFLSVLFLVVTVEAVSGQGPVSLGEVKTISKQPDYYHGWPTVAMTRDGGLLAVYSGGRDYHICPFGRIELMTSRDGGETWTWPRVIMDSATDDRDAGILVTAKGTILVVFFTSLDYQQHLSAPERLIEKRFKDDAAAHIARWRMVDERVSKQDKQRDLGMWMLRSTDGGLTWSERLPVPCSSPHGPTQLRDGRLLYVGKELWTTEKRVGVWESIDDGISWRYLTNLPTRPGEALLNYHEVFAVEAADGKIITHIRNHNGKRRETLQTQSEDGGRTWSIPKEIGVSGYPSHILRLKNDWLVMSYSYRKSPFGIRGKISKDNGGSWSDEFILTKDGANWDLGYPSTVELNDGVLLTLWYETVLGSPNAVLRQVKWTLGNK